MTPPKKGGAIVDLFAGLGGWSEGLTALGLTDIGVELMGDACATRAAAGHLTVRADLTHYPAEAFTGATGLIASPPCQDFSVAGKQVGRTGDRGRLIDIVPEWVDVIRPEWVVCEQVPPCLDIWREHAHRYRELGYSAWCGILNAANYGVPQTRQRAILIASRVQLATAPEPTHERDPQAGFFGTLEPWITMADALGWDGSVGFPRKDDLGTSPDGYRERDWRDTDELAFNLTEKARSWVRRERSGDRSEEGFDASAMPSQALTSKARSWWCWERPATTVAGDPRISFPGHHDEQHRSLSVEDGAIRLTVADALTLQGFRPDYPVQGSRTSQFLQVGNAIPPPLAAHIVAAATGQIMEVAA